MRWTKWNYLISIILCSASGLMAFGQNNSTANAQHSSIKQRSVMDIGPFALVISGDPDRRTGCSANRDQEFPAGDVFLDQDVCPDKDGAYRICPTDNKTSCIGLRWLENRSPAQLFIEFTEISGVPSVSQTQVQVWQGESRWQGEWRNLKGTLEQQGKRLLCTASEPDLKTRKIRWVFSGLANLLSIKCLSAFCPVHFQPLELMLQFEKDCSKADLGLYNAEFETDSGPQTSCVWTPTRTTPLKLRLARSQADAPTGAILRVRTADAETAISLDDLLENRCVYAPQIGLFIADKTAGVNLEQYKRQIEQKKTILERVRAMPDQTFEQAMKSHLPIQDYGFMMLSLACDNFKWITDRDASIAFLPPAMKGMQKIPYPMGMKTVFANEQNHPSTNKRFLEGGWLPIPVVTTSCGGVDYAQRTYVAPLDPSEDSREWPYLNDHPICVAEYTFENKNNQESDTVLSLQFYDNSQDAAPLEFLNNQTHIVVHQKWRILALLDLAGAAPLKAEIADGLITITGKLSPRASARCYVSLPGWEVKLDDASLLAVQDTLRSHVQDHWRKVLSGAMEIEIPDPMLLNVIRASQVHCLLAARNEPGGQIAAWAAADRYGPLESESHSVIRGMDFFGHDNFTRQSLDYHIHRYNSAGFLTTGYTLLGTGWHLWTLAEHFVLTNDVPWLKNYESDVAKVCQWIIKQRQKTQRIDCSGRKVLEYGLMPPGVLADWNAFAYHYCLNAYFYAGLKNAADALAAVGYGGASEFQNDAADFRSDILQSYHQTQRLSSLVRLQNGVNVPGYPSQAYLCDSVKNVFPGEDYNRSWCYDIELGAHQLVAAGVLDPAAREVADMLDHMEDIQFFCEGQSESEYSPTKLKADWFNLGGFSKVQPYYCRNPEIYAMRDDVKPFIRSYFNMLVSLLNTQNLSLWEHFHNVGAWNKTHETGYFLYQSRTMLLTERADQLWIAPFVPNQWLEDGLSVRIKNAPTRFGKVSYQIKSNIKNGYIEAVIELQARKAPAELVLRLRHPQGKQIQRVFVNDSPHLKFDGDRECIYLTPGPDKIVVHTEF